MASALPAPAGPAAEIAAFRAVADAAGYTGRSIQARLGTERELLARPADYPAHLKRLEGDHGALATLIRLFVLLASAARDDVDRALAPLGAAGLERLGLVRPEGDRLVAAARLIPHDALLIASDLSEVETEDYVPGVQRPSNTLANLTLRTPVGSALDVGTGNGIQALLLARHANRVVATDVSERALAYAAFNLELNGVGNVELRRGSFLEPVAGERFELVAANPPYVISPETSFVFRDSGLGRDRVSSELVRALPGVLADGGCATVMVSWIPDGEDMTTAPRSWLEGSGCDGWLFHTQTDDALAAAAGWNRDAPDPAEYARRLERWLAYYAEEGIDRIGYGTLILRRRPGGANWFRASALPRGQFVQSSHHLERLFAAQDFLEGLAGDGALLDARLGVAGDVALEQRLDQEQGRWLLREASLRLQGGLGFTAGLDEVSAAVVTRLDPARTLRETLAAVSAALELDAEELEHAGATLIRELLALGFVVPTE